ncbi:MAG: M48 family metalloprotease [Desulfosalsimonadaceae bacterium]
MSFFKKTLAVLSAMLLLCTAVAPPAQALSVREENELAREFLRAVNDYYDVIDDHIINDYIHSLGERLTQPAPGQPFTFKFYVIREDTFNAFAGPGGNIFIFSGLIEAMDTENELAAIMAHEIAHVTSRHIRDMIDRSKKTGIASMAGVIAGILVGLGGAPTAGTALSMGSLAAGQSMILAYSRENELQADFFGRKFLVDAGFDEYGAFSALQKIRSREWFGEDVIPTYLKTHPATSERMARIGNAIEKDPAALRNSYEYDRTRMRIMALYGKRGNALDRLRRMARNQPDDPAVQYGLGLALSEGGSPEKGIFHLKKAISLKPDDPIIATALGRAFFLAGENRSAIQTLEEIDNIAQYGPEGLRTLGRVQMEGKKSTEAIATFKKLLEHYPNDRQSLLFLGQSLGEEGRIGEAHYFLGRFHKAQGDVKNALFHFNQALSHTQDPGKEAELKEAIQEIKNAPRKPIKPEEGEGPEERNGLRLIETGKFHGEGAPPLGRGAQRGRITEHF